MSEIKDYAGYVNADYLKEAASATAILKQRSYEFMNIQIGNKVLDVGCGSGTDTIPMGMLVGSTGEVIGVDFDEDMIASGNEKSHHKGVNEWVRHLKADATELPFDENYFDSSRSERLLQHVSSPEKVLSEMVRVTKSGGWIVAIDTDLSSISIDTEYVEIEWKLRKYRADMMRNGYAGRQLSRLFKKQNLQDIKVHVFPIEVTSFLIGRQLSLWDEVVKGALQNGLVTKVDMDRLTSELEKKDAEGMFYGYAVQILITGRKEG